MPQKLTTTDQMELLREGDILYRFPSKGAPEATFTEYRKEEIDVYKIRSINRNDGIIRLVVADEALQMFTWPEDIERLDMKKARMISEGIWWTTTATQE